MLQKLYAEEYQSDDEGSRGTKRRAREDVPQTEIEETRKKFSDQI